MDKEVRVTRSTVCCLFSRHAQNILSSIFLSRLAAFTCLDDVSRLHGNISNQTGPHHLTDVQLSRPMQRFGKSSVGSTVIRSAELSRCSLSRVCPPYDHLLSNVQIGQSEKRPCSTASEILVVSRRYVSLRCSLHQHHHERRRSVLHGNPSQEEERSSRPSNVLRRGYQIRQHPLQISQRHVVPDRRCIGATNRNPRLLAESHVQHQRFPTEYARICSTAAINLHHHPCRTGDEQLPDRVLSAR
jgi:hypothetical protein